MKFTVKLPNFTMTRGKIPGTGDSGSGSGGALRSFRRNFRKILLWGGIGFLFFVLFAWLSLPTRAIAWRISHEAKAQGYIIDIEDVSISPFGGVTLENVQWTFSPSRPGQVPQKYLIPEVDVDISVLGLMMGNIDVELEAELDEGSFTAAYSRDAEQSHIQVDLADLPLYGVPKAAQALNAPLSGILAIKIDLTMPENKFADATGVIELTCAACRVGDGVEKLYVPDSKALKSGVVIPEIDMGTLSGRMTVEDGVATSDGPIETKSDDVWIEISGTINFKDPFGKSRIDMELKFNLSEKLQNESEPMRFMIQTAKPETKLDAPEEGLGFRLEGPVAKPRFIGIKSKSRRQSRLERRAKQRERDERRRSRQTPRTNTRSTVGDRDDTKDDDKPSVGEPLDVRPTEPEEEPERPEPEPVDEAPTDEAPTDEAPTDEAPTDEAPTDEAPTDEAPTDEAPTDEAPTDEPAEGDDSEAPVEGDGNEAPAEGDGNDGSSDEVQGEGGDGG